MVDTTLVVQSSGDHDADALDSQVAPTKKAVRRQVAAAAMALSLMLAPGSALFAQDDEDEEGAPDAAEQPLEEAAPEDYSAFGDVEEVVVTGSRIRRSTYTSISPLQIIHADVKREAGLIDAGEILQESSTASGVQFDLSFNGFVLDDGPGTTTVNLRGLEANRTLVLLNGRRIAPSGVEGAPTSPNLGIVPGLLVQQYDQLLDGASSIYGSDAIAGVVNAILRTDFDGFTIEVAPSLPAHDGGAEEAVGVTWGRNWDRGFVGFGAQHIQSDPVTLADRPWTAGCERNIEVDQGGQIRHRNLRWVRAYGMDWDDCTQGALIGRTFLPADPYASSFQSPGSIYHTPGTTNGGWPNFSESGASWAAGQFGIDGDGDGVTDVNWRDYSDNGREQFRHLFSPFKSTTAMVYGEYTFEGEANLAPYFEVLYGNSKFDQDSGALSTGWWVPALNPYNLCNPDAAGGVDCGEAMDALWASPQYIASFNEIYSGLCGQFGIAADACGPHAFGLSVGPIGPHRTYPVISVAGDRNLASTEATWQRAVAGLKGDLPFLNRGSLSDWTFDASITRSHSSGKASRPGIRQDRMELALGYYSNNWVPCESNLSEETRLSRVNSQDDPLAPLIAGDAAPGCVPVNSYAGSLYTPRIGDFATAAERDYVFDSRDFETEYTQTLFSIFATGDLFDLPAGAVAAGFGVEYRRDEIVSIPDQVASEGLLYLYFKDRGAQGSRTTREFFGEVEVPVVAAKRGAEELVVNMSVRYTDDEFYSGAWTGAAKLGWRPVEPLLIRATYGTSYRSPNLRELFLRGQSGFLNVFDPCFVPEAALEDSPELGGERTYNPANDSRDPHILERCRAEGVDPTLAGRDRFSTYSVEVFNVGSQFYDEPLNEETSTSKSVGFAWEQPFTEVFDLTLGMTYYDIDIEDTIIEPTTAYVIFDCYISQESTGQFCSQITRDLSDPTDAAIDFIDLRFVNRDQEKVRGVDLNLTFDMTFTVFERPLDVSFDVTGHRLIERSTLFVNNTGVETTGRFHREWFYAEHKAELGLRLDYERWRVSWSTRYLGDYRSDPGFVDVWAHVDSPQATRTETCVGPPTDVLCRDVEAAPDYWVHHVSTTYQREAWRVVAGVRNVFDKWPPQVDPSELWSQINNTPRGLGYDLNGRTYFMQLTFNFGGDR